MRVRRDGYGYGRCRAWWDGLSRGDEVKVDFAT